MLYLFFWFCVRNLPDYEVDIFLELWLNHTNNNKHNNTVVQIWFWHATKDGWDKTVRIFLIMVLSSLLVKIIYFLHMCQVMRRKAILNFILKTSCRLEFLTNSPEGTNLKFYLWKLGLLLPSREGNEKWSVKMKSYKLFLHQ